ncbi:MAG: hypothetical protein IPK26_16650 [Planctomycetes bacterium]|nr:hypothetical protein [Planctomycetota bacterium]
MKHPVPLLLTLAAFAPGALAQITVNTQDRAAVAALYNNTYAPAFANTNHGWTGATASCTAGTINAQFVTDTLTALNVFRAMAGMPSVTFGNPRSFPTSGSGLVDCQQGALMLHAAGMLSHNLPASSPCYTAAGNGALGTANLAGGVVGARGIDALIDDGVGNLGHRRWMLHEPQLTMAFGSTSTYMVLDVMAPMATGNRSRFAAWPPAGFVPYPWRYETWSFAVPGLNQDVFNPATHADFSAATVTVTRNGTTVPVNQFVPGQCIFCYDNGIHWTFPTPIPGGPGMADTPYLVTIANVRNCAQSTYSYTVTLFDPTGSSASPDECSGAHLITDGVHGPYDNSTATTSAPAWPCGSGGKDLWFAYQATGTGNLTATTCSLSTLDTVIEVFSGTCGALVSRGCNDDVCGAQSTVTVPVTPGPYRIRVGGFGGAAGTFRLDVRGPSGGATASSTNYGTGCYRASRSFYELFASGAAFDLDNARMRLSRSNGIYVAQSAGTFVAPTAGATILALGDDAVTTVNLTGSFPYHGGTTSTLEVCSNGFVSVATGNGSSPNPAAAAWLQSTSPRWGCWRDYDPTPAGSGKVKFQQVGTIAYITWDNVWDFGGTSATAANQWQLQFDLGTGNVTFAWQTMSNLGGPTVVGYSAPAPSTDLGSRDISASLPATFRTAAEELDPLALNTNLPRIGTTLALTITNYPSNATLGAVIESLTQRNPGIDLAASGAPGCLQFLNPDVANVVVVNNRMSVYNQPVPNSNALLGVRLFAQGLAFAPGANALGVLTSNGTELVVGQ